jgi:hypothetical protein
MDGMVEVAGVKWKRVENIVRDVREEFDRFDLQVKSFVINGSTTGKYPFWLCMPVSREKLIARPCPTPLYVPCPQFPR